MPCEGAGTTLRTFAFGTLTPAGWCGGRRSSALVSSGVAVASKALRTVAFVAAGLVDDEGVGEFAGDGDRGRAGRRAVDASAAGALEAGRRRAARPGRRRSCRWRGCRCWRAVAAGGGVAVSTPSSCADLRLCPSSARLEDRAAPCRVGSGFGFGAGLTAGSRLGAGAGSRRDRDGRALPVREPPEPTSEEAADRRAPAPARRRRRRRPRGRRSLRPRKPVLDRPERRARAAPARRPRRPRAGAACGARVDRGLVVVPIWSSTVFSHLAKLELD